jgi:hypothetical protein
MLHSAVKYLVNGCRRRCKNSEIQTLYDEHDGVKFIKLSSLTWAGHVAVDETDPARKVICTKPGGTGGRKISRPKLRCCDGLEEDVARVGCTN